MQPKTTIKFDQNTFERIKKSIKNMSLSKHQRKLDPAFATPLPEEIGIQLTPRCNLRCKHCFQWNETGFLQNMDTETLGQDIDIALIKKILLQTENINSNLYLWGGEPLVYNAWDELTNLLEKHPRWSVLCTNGLLIEKKMDSLLKISKNLAMLISLDGFQSENDKIRGSGVFNKVMRNIDLLIKLKEAGEFKGEISINCVISEANAGRLFDFLELFEEKGVNTVYFCFPWFLPTETSQKMDVFFKEKFGWLPALPEHQTPSWHAYKHHLSPEILEILIPQIIKINEKKWKIRVRYQPALEADEISDFIMGKEITAQKRTTCLATSTRMNVLPTGEVTVCKMFPEFVVGNLKNQDVDKLWQNEAFNKCRSVMACGLMPVCSKCVLLYLHGI